ncbi:MAG: cell division protein FtsL [bacterium]|jgi:cell division protein FtsL|nr:cell division protein FtsL [bacterium]MDD3806071.1 cell division protein FtsL [bacterium]MDD4558746.1 cell division protein FtsL [bacterium]
MALSSTMDRKNSYGRIKNRNKAIEKRRQGAPLDTRAAFAYMTILLLISLPAFIYLYQNACITQKGYQVQKLEERLTDLSLERERLQLKLDELSAPERVENMAQSRLNMIYPERVEFITIKEPVAETRLASAGRLTGVWNGLVDGLKSLDGLRARLTEVEASQP